jgi:hypothetical protein
VLACCLLALLTSTASAGTRKSTSRTFTLRARATRTFSVSYPDALEFSGARYSGSVRILVPRGSGARVPKVRMVRILSRGSSEGGSLFTVRVRNANPTGTAPVRIRVTATTVT